MPCPDCERLQAQLAIARKELALRGLDMRIAAVMVRIGTEATKARLLIALHDAGGAMRLQDLADVLPRAGMTALRSHMSLINTQVGEVVVENVRGEGYRLTIPGASLVLAALEPVDLARTVVA